jgi:hypothetical protein
MGRFLTHGRLLDGGETGNAGDGWLEAKLNMTITRETRFPFVTILTGLGVIFALVGFRRATNRLLLSGFTLGLLFMLGTDDLPSLYRLPMANKLQAFRVTYFIELFAFALAGMGAVKAGGLLFRLGAKVMPPVIPKLILTLVAVGLTGALWANTVRVVTPLLDTWNVALFDTVIKVLKKAGKPDPEKRIIVKFKRPGRKFRYALEHYVEIHGKYRSTCNHWMSSSPTTVLNVCTGTGAPWLAKPFSRMMGIRYLVVGKENAKSFVLPGQSQNEEYRHLGNFGKLAMIEDRRAAMLHEMPGPRVLITTRPAQWYWLTRAWVLRHTKKVGGPEVPWLVAGPSTALSDKTVLESVDAVMYLDDENIDKDRAALKAIAASGKPLLLSREIEGVAGHVFDTEDPSWDALLNLPSREAKGATFKRLDKRRNRRPDRLVFSTNSPEPTWLILSMVHFNGWKARIDGKPTTVFMSTPDVVSVLAPKGKHKIEFYYESSSMERWTAIVSILGWLCLLGLGLVMGARRIKKIVHERKKR